MKNIHLTAFLLIGSIALSTSAMAASGDHHGWFQHFWSWLMDLYNSLDSGNSGSGSGSGVNSVPEINAASGIMALGLLAALFGLVRERKKQAQ